MNEIRRSQDTEPQGQSVFRVPCPHCGVHLELEGTEQDWAGQRIDCPSCGKPLTIPSAETTSPPPQPSPQPQPSSVSASCPDISFICPRCQHLLAAPGFLSGERIECPSCGKPVTIPASGGTQPPKDAKRQRPPFPLASFRQTAGRGRAAPPATPSRWLPVGRLWMAGAAAVAVVAVAGGLVIGMRGSGDGAGMKKRKSKEDQCLYRIFQNGKWGFMDVTGKTIITPQYEETWDFSEGLAAVKMGGMWGYVDRRGKAIIPAQYEETWSFSEGLAEVKMGGKWGYINRNGKTVIAPQYERTSGFKEGLAEVTVGDKSGYIDRSGKTVIAIQYDWNYSGFSEGLAAVEKGGKRGYIDRSGKAIIALEHDELFLNFSEGLALFVINWRSRSVGPEYWGFIDRSGKTVIATQYECAHDFSEGLAAVKTGRKWGYIDKSGKMVIAPPVRVDFMLQGRACGRKGGGQVWLHRQQRNSGDPSAIRPG